MENIIELLKSSKTRLRKYKLYQSLRKTILTHKRWKEFQNDFEIFSSKSKNAPRFELSWKNHYPILDEKTSVTHFDAHYIYHPAWAARILENTRPGCHIDISSTLNFCAIVSAFIPVRFYDYRPATLNLNKLTSEHADLLSLPFQDESVPSLSCMHVVEHIGLGRYGDPIDPDGDLKAIEELKRVLSKGGNLLFVTPVVRPVIHFNAHRIYSYNQIISYFSGLNLQQFAIVDDKGQFFLDASEADANEQSYGCGCWWFTK